MTKEEKKAYLLLKLIIFHYHGLDEDEQKMLDETAKRIDAAEELEWAHNFVNQNYYDAFENARTYLEAAMLSFTASTRLSYLTMVWDANLQKGYVSELEAAAMLKLAKDWGIENKFVDAIKKG